MIRVIGKLSEDRMVALFGEHAVDTTSCSWCHKAPRAARKPRQRWDSLFCAACSKGRTK